jgi:hypothetical protein
VLTDVAVLVICAAMTASGVVMIVRWGGMRAERWPPFRRYIVAGLVTGVVSGTVVAAAARLVMALLALTSQDVHGVTTEGGATIGEITAGGTLGFVLFVGLAAGAVASTLYLVVGAVLPGGRLGGVLLGLLVLVLAGTRAEPLRSDNFDFELVGPDWLSVPCFIALGVFQGMLTWALAGRTGLRPLPVPRTAGRVAAAIVALVALPGFLAAVGDILGGA